MTNAEASLVVTLSHRVNAYAEAKQALLEALAEVREANNKLDLYYESVKERLTDDAKELSDI